MLASVNILSPGSDTQVYSAPTNPAKRASISVTITNRSNVAQYFNLALCPVGSTGPAGDGSNYIEYGCYIPANTAYERTGLILLTGQSMWVRCANGNVLNAVVYGIEE